jgi:hypothetical protein
MPRVTERNRTTYKVDRLFVDSHGIKGNTYYVDSVNGGSSNTGKDPTDAMATITQAYDKCTASQGDTVVVLPGHAETYSAAAALVLDTAGIRIIGLGHGNSRPTITLGSSAAVDIDVTAADVTLENIIFVMNVADIVEVFDLAAAGFTIRGCTFRDNAVDVNFVDLIKTSTTNNEADRLTFEDNEVFSPDTGNDAVVEIGGDLNELVFRNNYIRLGIQDSEAVLSVATGKDLTNCLITDNVVYRLNTTGDILVDSDTTANTGIIARNLIGHADTSGEVPIDATGCRQFENYASGVNDTSGYILPAVDS